MVCATLYNYCNQSDFLLYSLGKKMRVDLNITFPSLHCEDLHIDLMDIAGDVHNDVEETMVKKRLSLDGRYLDAEEIRVAANAAHEKDRERQAMIEKGLDQDYCGPCYGASDDPDHCCKNCDDVLELYKTKGWETVTIRMLAEQCVREGKNEFKRMSKGEGCNIAGHMIFNRVNGNFVSSIFVFILQSGASKYLKLNYRRFLLHMQHIAMVCVNSTVFL